MFGTKVDWFEFHKEGTVKSKGDKMKHEVLIKSDFPILRVQTNNRDEKKKLERLKNK